MYLHYTEPLFIYSQLYQGIFLPIFFFKTEMVRNPLTLSQTSPGFYVSAVQVF